MAWSAAPMRTRFDNFVKHLVRGAVETRGPVETDAEVTADTRRIDLWFTPRSSHAQDTGHLGLLGRLTQKSSTFEFFHNTPSGKMLADCMIKHGEFRHALALRKPPPRTPTQWVISSGRPTSGIKGLWLRPMTSWPSGVYEAPPLLWTRLVVVNELPVTRDTLLLRLLGKGAVFRRAIGELKALPEDAPERMLALPILLRLRLDVPDDPAKQTTDDKEFLVETQDIVETWRREAREEGLVCALIRLYQVRFGAMPEDLRAVLGDTHNEATLGLWVEIIGTRPLDEIVATIRKARRN